MGDVWMDRSMVGWFKGMDARMVRDFTETGTYFWRWWTICDGMWVVVVLKHHSQLSLTILIFHSWTKIRIGWKVLHRLIGLSFLIPLGWCLLNGSTFPCSLSLSLGLTEMWPVSLLFLSLFLFLKKKLLTPIYQVTFSLPGPSTTIIVLSQLDSRYYRDVAGRASWTMDFTLVKEGQKEPIADSGHSDFYLRSVHLEVELEAGNYIVYVGKSFSFGEKEQRSSQKK